jgi:hypothetical protein
LKVLAFDKTCNVRWGDHTENYWECEKVYVNTVFAATYPRYTEKIIDLYSNFEHSLELMDEAICEGNETVCDPSPTMAKVMAAQMLNDLRMFVMELVNTDEYSQYIPDPGKNKNSGEGGLIPRMKYVKNFGHRVFERSAKKGSWIYENIGLLKRHGYDFRNFLKHTSLALPEDLFNPTPQGDNYIPGSIAGFTLGNVPSKEDNDKRRREDILAADVLEKQLQEQKDKITKGLKGSIGGMMRGVFGKSKTPEETTEEEKMKEKASGETGKSSLLQINGRASRKGKSSKRRGGSISKPGDKCKKDAECSSDECRKMGMFSGRVCAPDTGSLQGKTVCRKDKDCFSQKCRGNFLPFSNGECDFAPKTLESGEKCSANSECKSNICTLAGFCAANKGAIEAKHQCRKDMECESQICRGNWHGVSKGICLKGAQEAGEECDDDAECVSDLGCTEKGVKKITQTRKVGNFFENEASGYVGKCYHNKHSQVTEKPCRKDEECASDYCKVTHTGPQGNRGLCSDEPKPGIMNDLKTMYRSVKDSIADGAASIKRYVKQKWNSQWLPGIQQGTVMGMMQDHFTMYGVEVKQQYTANEKAEVFGDAYRDINKFGEQIRSDVGLYREAYYDKALGQEKSKILLGLQPVVQYTITFTLDIESQAPGFCTPSSAALQVIVSKSWTGITTDTRAFNKRQMCMSLRLAALKTYFMLDLCYDLQDCKGLQDIDDESEKQSKGEVIVSNIEIGFSVFEFLQAAQWDTIDGGAEGVATSLVTLIDVGAGDECKEGEARPKDKELNQKCHNAVNNKSLKGDEYQSACQEAGCDWVNLAVRGGMKRCKPSCMKVEESTSTPEVADIAGAAFDDAPMGASMGANDIVEDVPAQIDSDKKQMVSTATAVDEKGRFVAKIKNALKEGAQKVTSMAVSKIFSGKMAWAFAQAFVKDDELTNEGDVDFMKYGVSLVSLAQFFAQAVAQAMTMVASKGGSFVGEVENVNDWFDPSAPAVPTASFKLNNELVLEGRGSLVLSKRACFAEEKKAKEARCNSGDVKFWGITDW